MDRQIVYPGQILPETSLLQMAKDSMLGLAKLSAAMLGTSTMANGFAVTPTGPASLQVVCAPGEIYSLTSIDALAFSTLPADTTHSIMKQGVLLDAVTLSCPAPGTTGQSINYLVQATYQDTDSAPVLLPYYNSANPALPFSGVGNNGLTQNTSRKGVAVVAVKAGASAATGSQTTPAPDSGYVGLYVVTVAFGQTTITSTSISQYASAPLLPSGLLQSIQGGNTSFALDTGTANTYVFSLTPALTARQEGIPIRIKVKTTNTAASTVNDGLGVTPLVGGAHSALQGGEMQAGGFAWIEWSSTVGGGSYILLFCTGAPEQVAPGTKSQHAAQLGQVSGVVGQSRNLLMNITAASANATLSADEVILETGLGGLRYCLSGISKDINLAITGVGGMDTGLAPVSGWVALYLAFNPLLPLSSTNPMLIGKDATSAVQPEVYGGANMPAGYTASALVAVLATNASRLILPARVVDRHVYFFASFFSGLISAINSLTSTSLSFAVPPNAKTFTPNCGMSPTLATNVSAAVAQTSAGQGTPGYSTGGAGSAAAGSSVVTLQFAVVPLMTPQVTFIAASQGGGTGSASFNSYGFDF